MKNIILFAFVTSTMLIQAQNIPASSFQFQNPNSILPGRIFGTERETGHNIRDPKVNTHDLRSAGLFSIQIIDSLLFWQWDTTSNRWIYLQKISDITYNDANLPKSYIAYYWEGEWSPADRYVIGFDDNNNIVNEVEQRWDGSGWENAYKTISVFDENNNLINESFQAWDGNDWVNNSLHSFSYNGHNKNISGLIQRYDGTSWENESIYTIAYDANQNQLNYTLQIWNGDAWVNDGQYLYTYDAQNHVTSNLYQIWDGFGWENVIQYLFMYNDSGLLSSELSQYWIGNVWEDFARFSFTYNAQDQLINQIVETWAVNQWINADFYTYTYDANGKELTELREIWNGVQWINSEESAFQYQDTFLISEVFKYYNEDGNAILYGDSSYYYFNEITGTEPFADGMADIVVYPNPGNGTVTIRSSLPVNSVQAFNLLGQLVFSKHNYSQQDTYDIDLSDFAKGIYWMNISSGKEMHTRRIVIQ